MNYKYHAKNKEIPSNGQVKHIGIILDKLLIWGLLKIERKAANV